MAETYWQTCLADLEPTVFPDLTGRSASAKKNLEGFHSAEQKLSVEEHVSCPISTATFLATCAKVVALYLGDSDFCVDHIVGGDISSQSHEIGPALPLRIVAEADHTNKDILCQIERLLEEGQKFGPPTRRTVETLFDANIGSLSNVLVMTHGNRMLEPSVLSEYEQKYDVIFQFIADTPNDSRFFSRVRMHCRSSFVLSDDTPHVLAAFDKAFASVHLDPTSGFLSWESISNLRQSISNPDVKVVECQDEQTVHALFEKHAAETPNGIALDFLEEDHRRTTWTFATLDSIANHIANRLIQANDLQIEDSVPICVSKSPAFYACVLAVLKAGGVFTPFSGSPHERQKFMLDELKSKVLLCSDDCDVSWASDVSTLNVTSLIEETINSKAVHKLQVRPKVRSSNLCYHMYTSGSTGRPKAVSLEHGNAVQTACMTRDLVPWKCDSRILQQAGVTFDMCYFETFFAWNTGIVLCSAPDNSIYNALTEVINDMGATLLGSTPSVALTIDQSKVPRIEWLYCIGEALPQSLADAWEGRLVNSYGPTEAAQMVTLYPVSREIKSAVIGRPFDNTSFTILRKGSTDVVPILGVGELCIGGPQVARGYFKNPEKTAQSFITLRDQTIYRTGDIVRMLSNGVFEFIGRVDDQVKIRGQRVELGEVNKTIERSHPEIRRATAQILKVNDTSKSQLVAFITLGDSPDDRKHEEIRQLVNKHLSNTVPAYMVPRFYLFIDQIPLSAAGKVNRRALTQILRESDQITTTRPPNTMNSSHNIIRVLKEVFSEFCGLSTDKIGQDTSIYQLGIDSISAIQIAHRLRGNSFQVHASDVLNYPTISQLCCFLEDHKGKIQDRGVEKQVHFDYESFDQQHRSTIYRQCEMSTTKIMAVRPASPLQSSMIAQSTNTSGSLYFNHLSYRLPENLNVQRFRDAWDALVSKHEMLRTGFVHLDDTVFPVAMITYHARSLPIPVSHSPDGLNDLKGWRDNFAESATQNIHLPPWQVLVSLEHNTLYFSAHHALYDAQVLEIFMRDLALAYDGARLPHCPSIELHLAKFLEVTSMQSEESAEFWQQCGKAAIPTEFPLMNPLLEDSHEIEVEIGLSPLPLVELETSCRKASITIQVAAQAAWGYLLGSITGQDSVTFGTVLGGRVADASEEVAFPMITTVPTVVNNGAPQLEVLNALIKFNADVQKHQFMPLKKIQSFMGSGSRTLFDTLFTYQRRTHRAVSTTTQIKFLDNNLTIEYPISVELEPTESGHLQFSVFYLANYMRSEQACLLVKQFHFLLQNIIFGNETILRPTITDADPQLFSITPPSIDSLPSEHSLLHHTVELRARDAPDRVALEFVTSLEAPGPQKLNWTFRELDDWGNRFANFLVKGSVTQGSLVALCFDKCPEAAFVMLGISKAGCGFLALDPGAPIERTRFIMEDSRASMLLSKGKLARNLQSALGDVVIDLEVEDLSHCPASPVQLSRKINEQETSYCLYTSGTTGTPKGCLITHENVIQVFCCFERLYAHNENSRWLQFASYHFDVSVMEHFWSWFVGMTVVKAGRDLVLQDLANAISSLKITHIDLTPSLARLLDPKDVPTLADGVFVTGGEMLRRDIVEAWGNSGAIHNAYGPTEATIGVTMYQHVPKNGRPSNIGWPFHVVGVLVVNPSNPTLPTLRGGVGELIVSGKLVARGYLRRDELTQQRFIEVAGQKCYRTGDLVRLLSDGSIEFLGRADDQVKLRGQRLETGEINNVIKQRYANIDDVSTQVLRHPKQQKEQLVSFVAMKGMGDKTKGLSLCQTHDAANLVPDLKAACVEKLPGYMVPTHILLVNKMPLSANNKIEARQFKLLYESTDLTTIQSLIENAGDNVQENLDTENYSRILEVLSRSLGIEAVSVSSSSSLFELGLDSISIINFSRSLKKAGYKQASPSMIMKNATMRKLTIALQNYQLQAEEGSIQIARQRTHAYNHRYKRLVASVLNVSYDDIEAIAPCTALQAGIISRTLESTMGPYFAAFTFDLKDGTDEQKLRRSCQRVCDKVQVLRTKFIPTDDGYIQVAMRRVELPWIDCHESSEENLDDVLRQAYGTWWKQNQQEISRPFELVIARTSTRSVLALHIFHALYDGNSLPLIMNAVISEYQDDQAITYGPAFFDALPYGPLREEPGAERFWVEHLSALDPKLLTKLDPLIQSSMQHDTCVTHRIDPISGLEACRRRLNVTHQAMAQACWTVILQDLMSGPLILGMILSGRSIDFEGVENVIGPMFNTIPFLLYLSGDDTWRSAILRCHEFNTAASTYQHTPLRDVQRWTRNIRPKGALFESLFVFQKEFASETNSNPIWTSRDQVFEADYPLAMEVEQTLDGGFNLTLACQAHMSDEKTSNSLLRRFEQTLVHMVENIDSPIADMTTNVVKFKSQKPNSSTNGSSNGEGSKRISPTNSNGTTINGNGTAANGNGAVLSKVANSVRDEIAALAGTRLEEIHGDTSIFELGLDSIDAVKLSSRLKKATGTQIPVSQIMRLLTIDKIAGVIDRGNKFTHSNSTSFDLDKASNAIESSLKSIGLDFAGIQQVLPCTPLQESMLADMINSRYERYLNFDVLKLETHTDIDTLKSAWTTVVNKFQILRTRFISILDPRIESTFAQLVVQSPKLEFREAQINSKDGFSPIFADIRDDIKSTFEEKPGLRLTIVHDPQDKAANYLVLALPHAMYDGWSLGLIHDSVQKAYRETFIEVSPLEPALSSILNSAGESSLQFWRQELADTKSTLIPSKSSAARKPHRAQRPSQMSLSKVQDFCRQNKVTIAALCQTIWCIVLAYYTEQLDISFAQVLSGRTDEATNQVIFPTMNTVISRAIIHGTRSSMVQYIQESLSAVSEHQHFPLRKALAFAAGERSKKLFNTLFIFQKASNDSANEPGQKLYESVDSASNVEYPVCVEAEVTAHEMIWRTACEESVFNKQETKALLEDLDGVLNAVIQEPSKDAVEFNSNRMMLCGLPPVAMPKRQDAAYDKEHANTNGHSEVDKWSAVEEKVREVIADVARLDTSEIQKSSSLFGLGLDSISTIKVSSLLRKQNLKVGVNEILSAGSVGKIAELCNGQDSYSNGSAQHKHSNLESDEGDTGPTQALLGNFDVNSLLASHEIEAHDVGQVLPTTGGQLLLLSRWQNEGVYYSSLDFSIYGCEDIKQLQTAWIKLVQASPMLRTIFLATGNHTVPIVQATLKNVQVQFIEVSADSDLDNEANRMDITASNSMTSPCALFAQKVGDKHFDLALKISHALYDGFSIKMLISSLQDLINDTPSQSSTSTYTFSKYLAATAATEPRHKFWSRYLADVQCLPLPSTCHDNDNTPSKQIHIVKANVLVDLASLRTFARQNQVSVQSLLIASYAITHAQTLHNHHSSKREVKDVLIGMFMANRNIDGADELAAPTLGFAPIRVREPLTKSLTELAKTIQDDMREISEEGRSQVGLWELQEWVGGHVKVDVWVNILRQWLPDASESSDQVQVVTGEKSQDLREQYDVIRSDEDVARGLLLKNNPVRGCYDYPMMDLEATIKDDNLDIGIQVPTTLFGLDRASVIIDEVSARLNEAVKGV